MSRAQLRRRELPPPTETGKPLPVAQILPLGDGDDPLTNLEMEGVPSAHGFIAFGKTASRLVQISLVTGAAPKIGRVGSGSVRAMPDSTWGASVGEGELRAGAFDTEGAIATPSTVKLAEIASIGAAIGTLADGEVVFGGSGMLVIGHSKAGVMTAEPAIAIDNGGAITDVDGRAVIAWTRVGPGTLERADRRGPVIDRAIAGMHARLLRPGADGPVVDLPSPPTAPPCLTADRAWILGLGEVMQVAPDKPVVEREVKSTVLLGCTPEAALLRDRDQRKPFEICTDTCRVVAMPSGAPDSRRPPSSVANSSRSRRTAACSVCGAKMGRRCSTDCRRWPTRCSRTSGPRWR